MKKLKELPKTDIYGEPVDGQHVNLLHQKMTADDDDDIILLFGRTHTTDKYSMYINRCIEK